MNNILNRGFVSPYIDFRFAAGDLGSEQIIDTTPPRYFASFHQERTVGEACSFTLQLNFVPQTFTEQDALTMHKMLLGSHDTAFGTLHGFVDLKDTVINDEAYRPAACSYGEDEGLHYG